MAVRKWGVRNAPGTQITELESPPRITDKDLGTAVFVGLTKKGEMGKPIKVTSWGDFLLKCGNPATWASLPECVRGFFTETEGTGKAYIIRVPDTTAVKATKVFTTVPNYNYMITFTAKSEGSWAGSYKEQSCTISAKTSNTVTTDLSGIPDHTFTGGYLEKGTSVFKILSQVGSSLVLDAPFTESVPSTDWYAVKRNTDGILSVRTYPNSQDNNYFDVMVYLDNKLVLSYEGLTLNPSSPKFIETVINEDSNNTYVTVNVSGGNGIYDGVVPVSNFYTVTSKTTTPTGDTKIVTNVSANRVPFCDDEIIGYSLRAISSSVPLKLGSIQYRIKEYGVDSGNIYFVVESGGSGLAQGTLLLLDANVGFTGGYDGELAYKYITNGYSAILPILQYSTSPIKEIDEGFLKICVPSYSELDNNDAITQAGIALAEALNHQFRVEVAQDEDPLDIAENNRSDFAVLNYPCWGKVIDSFGGVSTIPLIGDILGEECRIANAYDGYHKAEAGVDAVLSRVISCVNSTGNIVLTDELIEEYNPAGINCLVEKGGNLVIWGDRTLASTTTWRWKHQRELMSYYEHILLTSNDWLNFQINSPELWVLFKNYLKDYFFREFKKGALYSDNGKFDDACEVIVDWTNNSDVTIDNGELIAEIWLKMAGTVEKIKIGIGKQYVYEF